MQKIRVTITVLLLGLFCPASPQSVVNTVHNLSVSGPGAVRATSETEVCIFCHTPHNSKPLSPLWNREDPGGPYILYGSSTLDAAPGQPDGSSVLCLSCHDGTIALGNVLNRTSDIDMTAGIVRMPAGHGNLSTDLSDDHPVSFLYNSAVAASDGQLRDPSAISYPVSLENGKVQCTSCHDPHRNIFPDFLVATTRFSQLCTNCHSRDYWSSSGHNTSTSTWNGSGTNPWPRTPYATVAENACENCHSPHSAGGKFRLLNYLAEESNCLNCHNGNVAATNIVTQLSKSYLHNVYGYNLSHDPVENAISPVMHVECADCHNPHATRVASATAPYANGYIMGVQGVTQAGTPIYPIQYQYELCYRCHADSPDKPPARTVRQIIQNNVRLEFDQANPSYHPITAAGKNTNCISLIRPAWSEASILYCTDCHASDGAGAPAGPHGSVYQSILKYRYEKADFTIESSSGYALCYSCHSRTSILGDNSFGEHKKHIVDERTPCNACHDPHGISSMQGTATNNTHLINFDRSIVSPNGVSNLRFVDTGINSGYCFLTCHGRPHGAGMNY